MMVVGGSWPRGLPAPRTPHPTALPTLLLVPSCPRTLEESNPSSRYHASAPLHAPPLILAPRTTTPPPHFIPAPQSLVDKWTRPIFNVSTVRHATDLPSRPVQPAPAIIAEENGGAPLPLPRDLLPQPSHQPKSHPQPQPPTPDPSPRDRASPRPMTHSSSL